ncbi:MAG: archaeosortase/exosortase family protein [Spirulina sp.]
MPQRIAFLGLGLVGLHIALIVSVTGNADQVVLSLLFWGAIADQVRQGGPLRWARSPLARILGLALLGLLGLKSLPIPATESAFVRLFPLLALVGWSLLVRQGKNGHGWKVWALVVALSVPPRALPLVLETVLDRPIRGATAAAAAFGLHFLGFDVAQQGTFIQLPSGTVEVEFACTGAALLGLLLQVSVLLAVVTAWAKIRGLILGSVAIAALLSTVRVAIMAAVVGNEALFQFWHGSSGGQLFTLIALAILSYRTLGKDERWATHNGR